MVKNSIYKFLDPDLDPNHQSVSNRVPNSPEKKLSLKIRQQLFSYPANR